MMYDDGLKWEMVTKATCFNNHIDSLLYSSTSLSPGCKQDHHPLPSRQYCEMQELAVYVRLSLIFVQLSTVTVLAVLLSSSSPPCSEHVVIKPWLFCIALGHGLCAMAT